MTVALFIGLKEILKYGAVGALVSHLHGNKSLPRRVFYFSSVVTALAAPVVLFVPPDHRVASILVRWNETVVTALLIVVVAVIYLDPRGSSFDPVENPGRYPGLAFFVWGLLPPLYFFPDWCGSLAFLRETPGLYDAPLKTAGALTAGAGIGGLVIFLTARLLRRVPPSWRWFGIPQTLLVLAGIKLAAGGVRGYADYSLIPSLQRIFMKFTHDVVHHLFTILLVPDHPLLSVSSWNFIGYFFGPNFGLIVTLVFLLLPSGVFLVSLLSAPVSIPESVESPAEQRLVRARVRTDRLRRSTAVWVFCLLVLSSWFVRGGSQVTTVHDPEPRPVVADKGVIVIPRTDPSMDLESGKIYKFSYRSDTRTMRFFITRRPDGSLAVCLDACEICPPKGYGQDGNRVICLFCNTPISTDTLGTPGGCNPIPLGARITNRDIRIDVDELKRKWDEVDGGKTREDAVP